MYTDPCSDTGSGSGIYPDSGSGIYPGAGSGTYSGSVVYGISRSAVYSGSPVITGTAVTADFFTTFLMAFFTTFFPAADPGTAVPGASVILTSCPDTPVTSAAGSDTAVSAATGSGTGSRKESSINIPASEMLFAALSSRYFLLSAADISIHSSPDRPASISRIFLHFGHFICLPCSVALQNPIHSGHTYNMEATSIPHMFLTIHNSPGSISRISCMRQIFHENIPL